jgi:hypothetical protein
MLPAHVFWLGNRVCQEHGIAWRTSNTSVAMCCDLALCVTRKPPFGMHACESLCWPHRAWRCFPCCSWLFPAGIEDPNFFFQALMTRPYAANIVWGPHFYAQSVIPFPIPKEFIEVGPWCCQSMPVTVCVN